MHVQVFEVRWYLVDATAEIECQQITWNSRNFNLDLNNLTFVLDALARSSSKRQT